MSRGNSRRQTVRTLITIDTLAPYRRGLGAVELTRLVAGRTGEPQTVRTTYRDLRLLESLGLVVHDSHGIWKLCLKRSEALQTAAMGIPEAIH